jgi:hypothetical protein
MPDGQWQLPVGIAGNACSAHLNATVAPENCILFMLALDKARAPLYNAASSGGKPSSPMQPGVELDEDKSVAVRKAVMMAFQKQDDDVIIFASRL